MNDEYPTPRAAWVGNLWAIFKRELRQYFVSPIAYFVAFVVLLIAGLLFNAHIHDWIAAGAPGDSTAAASDIVFLMVFMAPLLTMRLIAEENREGTIELLLTMPVRDVDIVLGKFLGAWAYYTIVLAATLVYPFILSTIAQPDQGAAIAAYMGAWLYGGAALAIGLMFSSLTENQVVAGFLSLSALVILYWSDIFSRSIQNDDLQNLVRSLSMSTHYYRSYAIGIVRLEDMLFYLFVMAGALFVSIRVVESRRWR